MYRFFLALLAAAGFGVATPGCNQQPALDLATIEKYRSQFVLADEPDGAQTVVEARNVMYGVEESAEEHDHDHAADEHDHSGETAEEHAAHADDEQGHDEHEHAEGEESHDHAHDDHDHEHDHSAATEGKEPVIPEMDVVLVGSVGGVPNPSEQSHPEFPFAKNQAIFFLADPEAVMEMEEHEHQHAPGEECSFCAAHAADSAYLLAVVQFADESGKPLPVDVRDLFNLKEKETVVVRGKAKVAPGGILTVDADGLYVRR